MKWPNMYDKQWKIHNKFEKDECKWSEVDFYQEFFACCIDNVLQLCIQISAHWNMRRHQMHVWGTEMSRKNNTHNTIINNNTSNSISKRNKKKKKNEDVKNEKKKTVRMKRTKQSTKCAILSGIWVFEKRRVRAHCTGLSLEIHCAYKTHGRCFSSHMQCEHCSRSHHRANVFCKEPKHNQHTNRKNERMVGGAKERTERKKLRVGQFSLNLSAYQMSQAHFSTLNFKYQDA